MGDAIGAEALEADSGLRHRETAFVATEMLEHCADAKRRELEQLRRQALLGTGTGDPPGARSNGQ